MDRQNDTRYTHDHTKLSITSLVHLSSTGKQKSVTKQQKTHSRRPHKQHDNKTNKMRKQNRQLKQAKTKKTQIKCNKQVSKLVI